MAGEKKARGRPTDYREDLATAILVRLAAGESLRAVCKPDDMPAESTVRLWAIDDREGFSARYARAREAQMEVHAEDILEIADGSGADVQRDKLRVDSRKWLMSKIASKTYGDRITHAGDKEAPITVNFTSEDQKVL